MAIHAVAHKMIESARELRAAVNRLRFSPPVTHVYNPLDYAWDAHETYLRKFGNSRKRVVFLGMNPGPFGMVQTGVPFGEVKTVRDWMRIEALIGKPGREHPRRAVEGFGCERSEVSGKRLWGLFSGRFNLAEDFFVDHFVVNYCPLAFFDTEGGNLTPDKLPASQSASLLDVCDQHLRRVVEILNPEWMICVGDFAEKRARRVFPGIAPIAEPTVVHGTAEKPSTRPPVTLCPRGAREEGSVREAVSLKIGKILHPSPASPAANRDWAKQATQQLRLLGIWA